MSATRQIHFLAPHSIYHNISLFYDRYLNTLAILANIAPIERPTESNGVFTVLRFSEQCRGFPALRLELEDDRSQFQNPRLEIAVPDRNGRLTENETDSPCQVRVGWDETNDSACGYWKKWRFSNLSSVSFDLCVIASRFIRILDRFLYFPLRYNCDLHNSCSEILQAQRLIWSLLIIGDRVWEKYLWPESSYWKLFPFTIFWNLFIVSFCLLKFYFFPIFKIWNQFQIWVAGGYSADVISAETDPIYIVCNLSLLIFD